MQNETAERLTRLAATKTGYTVVVEHHVAYYPDMESNKHKTEYHVAYFFNESQCKVESFSSWTAAHSFLKQLTLRGLPNV